MLLCSVITWLTGDALDLYTGIAYSINARALGTEILVREQDLWYAYLIDPELIRVRSGDMWV